MEKQPEIVRQRYERMDFHVYTTGMLAAVAIGIDFPVAAGVLGGLSLLLSTHYRANQRRRIDDLETAVRGYHRQE